MKKFFFIIFLFAFGNLYAQKCRIAVIISANSEWKVVKEFYPKENYNSSPWGDYFFKDFKINNVNEKILFFHGGWGKVAAAGSAQYVISTYQPEYLINIGTCGGFEGSIKKYEVVLVDKTIIYDIIEAMGDSKEAINDYSINLDLNWLKLPYPSKVIKTVMVSADKDLIPAEIESLKNNYNAIAGDWETGAIAYTVSKNKKKLLILRGVSDLVSNTKGEAYGKEHIFINGTDVVMKNLLITLPLWLEKCNN